jgi:trehalose 6-phosphate synthase/phosphatase
MIKVKNKKKRRNFRAKYKVTAKKTSLNCFPFREAQNKILNAFQTAQKKLIVLDYDGTLRKFEKNPEAASPEKSLKELLNTLAAKPGVTLAIVSGRKQEELEKWFGQPNFILIGDHGTMLKLQGATTWRPLIKYKISDRENLWAELEGHYAQIAGAVHPKSLYFERKRFSFGLNYRYALPTLQARLQQTLFSPPLQKKLAQSGLQVQMGVSDLEILNRDMVKKSHAIKYLTRLDKYDFAFITGDAWTDEDMFEAAPRGAHTIKLGPAQGEGKQTKASCFLEAPEDTNNEKKVVQFLDFLGKLSTI